MHDQIIAIAVNQMATPKQREHSKHVLSNNDEDTKSMGTTHTEPNVENTTEIISLSLNTLWF